MTVGNTRMRNVYAVALADFYRYDEREIAYATFLVKKNMRELGIAVPSELRRMNVLNVGTGRETVALQHIGAKTVRHFDISDVAVRSLRRFKRMNQGYGNIHTRPLDLCKRGSLSVDDGIDLVYLSGVVHHLVDPNTAFCNILDALNPGAKMFIRIYRSGILYYMVVDFIRRLVSYRHRRIFDSLFRARHPKSDLRTRHLYMSAYDEFFVPCLNLYDPRQVDDYFADRGFSALHARRYRTYNHEENARLDNAGISLLYHLDKPSNANSHSPRPFPDSVDQLRGIAYRQQYIRETVELMEETVSRHRHISIERQVALALDLFELAVAQRQLSILKQRARVCGESGNLPPTPDLQRGRDMHRRIQTRLRRALQGVD